jgi:RNA polymerase sigma-70 factor (ECF subfamily)
VKDQDTITLLKEGDPEAFRAVFDEYHRRVYAYVLKKTNSSYIAEETMQVAFVKLWRFRRSLKTDVSLFTQVFRITTTTMVDLIRIEQRKNAAVKIAGQSTETTTEPTQVTEANDLGKQMHQLIRRMPDMQQKVFEMSRFQEKTHREIAYSLSISVKTVETHISRAIRFLRQKLE